jgi:hypothetical protein
VGRAKSDLPKRNIVKEKKMKKPSSANLSRISPEAVEILQKLTEKDGRRVKSVCQKRPEDYLDKMGRITSANKRCNIGRFRV